MEQSEHFILAVCPDGGTGDSVLSDLSHFCAMTLNEYLDGMSKKDRVVTERDLCLELLSKWDKSEQVDFLKSFLFQMDENQRDQIQVYINEQRRKDLISLLAKSKKEVAHQILRNLDVNSLKSAKLVCKEWLRVISNGICDG